MVKRILSAAGIIVLSVMLGAGSCGDGNPNDDPSTGFDKCLNHANC